MNQNNLIETPDSNKPAAQNAQERRKNSTVCVSRCYLRFAGTEKIGSKSVQLPFLASLSQDEKYGLINVCPSPPTCLRLVSVHRNCSVDKDAMTKFKL